MAIQRAVLGRSGGDRNYRFHHSLHTPGEDLLAMAAMHVDPVIPASVVIPVHSAGSGDVQAVPAHHYLVLKT